MNQRTTEESDSFELKAPWFDRKQYGKVTSSPSNPLKLDVTVRDALRYRTGGDSNRAFIFRFACVGMTPRSVWDLLKTWLSTTFGSFDKFS